MAKRKVKHPRKKKKEATATRHRFSSRELIAIAGAAGVLVAIFIGFSSGILSREATSGGETPVVITEGASLGPDDAPVTVTEYSDFQ